MKELSCLAKQAKKPASFSQMLKAPRAPKTAKAIVTGPTNSGKQEDVPACFIRLMH